METWEHECAINDARARISTMERDREDLWALEREAAYGEDEFLRQLSSKRTCASNVGEASECGIAERASLRIKAAYGPTFESSILYDFESTRRRALALVNELNCRIEAELACISGHEEALAAEEIVPCEE